MKTNWNKENIITYIEEHNDVFIDFIEFKGRESIVKIICSDLHYNTVKFDTYLRRKKDNRKCRTCEDINKMIPFEIAVKHIEDNNYRVLSTKNEYYFGKYKGKLYIQCNNNHNPYWVKFTAFKNDNKRCRQCSIDKRKNSYEYVYNYIKSFGHNLLSTVYINNETPLLIKCPHGHEYLIKFKHFVGGVRCNICNMQSGEQEIKRVLDRYNIDYDIQYKFNDCKNIRQLPFDFIIYIDNTYILIEFDGIQHFKPMKNYGGYEHFLYRKINDGIKNEYCYFNNIPLIRIPYWDFNNIEKILIKELNLK